MSPSGNAMLRHSRYAKTKNVRLSGRGEAMSKKAMGSCVTDANASQTRCRVYSPAWRSL